MSMGRRGGSPARTPEDTMSKLFTIGIDVGLMALIVGSFFLA
jgi:hypothetical protein